jgi:hypothetical protein
MKKSIFALTLIFCFQVYALIDLSQYHLTEKQIEIFRTFEAKEKYSQEFLLKLAQAMHNSNIKKDIYIPPYTEQELEETIKWARGGAFAAYASFAGMVFDGESYRDDCPNVALFRFGQASGTEFIPQDVMKEAINQSHYFQVLYSRNKEDFQQSFIEEARRYGFIQYLSFQ